MKVPQSDPPIGDQIAAVLSGAGGCFLGLNLVIPLQVEPVSFVAAILMMFNALLPIALAVLGYQGAHRLFRFGRSKDDESRRECIRNLALMIYRTGFAVMLLAWVFFGWIDSMGDADGRVMLISVMAWLLVFGASSYFLWTKRRQAFLGYAGLVLVFILYAAWPVIVS